MKTLSTDILQLLHLLAAAINGTEVKIRDGVDWSIIFNTAQRQGVGGLLLEALEQAGVGEKKPAKDLLMKCFARTVMVERMYAKHLMLAKEATEVWKRQGIRTIVFKGLAHSRYYPKADHREFGDFDCFLLDMQGKSAYKQGNEVARRNGWSVDDGWYKHSHIAYKGLTIENHQFFTSARRGGTDMALHKYMVEAIGDGSELDKLEGTDIYVLPLEAEGLFMLYHSLTHFLVEGINLRHFVDWACWIMVNQGKMSWADFYELCKRFRLDGFVDVLNTISVKYLGVTMADKAIVANSPYAERTIMSALYDDSSIYNRSKGRWYERMHVIGNAFRYSWKYRDVAHYSMVGYVWQFVKGFIMRREEE